MAKPRTPLAKAAVTGADVKHPERFADRTEPVVHDGVGDPPEKMTDDQKAVWREMAADIPWLLRPHRYLLGTAVRVQTRINNGDDVGVQWTNLLRQCLGQMGATPSDASKAGVIPSEREEDPAEKHFN